VITKEDIFHYVYAVLHNPTYREKYASNLKRDFPRIPLYKNFSQWTDWGKQLMELHINYESVIPYPLKRQEKHQKNTNPAIYNLLEKGKLKQDKENGIIYIDGFTELHGIPKQAWEYKLGGRSSLEWILDQYRETKPKDPTIAEKFNAYSFKDYKEVVIDLLKRVCTISIKTIEITDAMKTVKNLM